MSERLLTSRVINCSVDISIVKKATARPARAWFKAYCTARVVFPIAGLPPKMMNSEGLKPVIRRSVLGW